MAFIVTNLLDITSWSLTLFHHWQIAGKMYRPAVDNLLLEAMVGSVEISSTIAKIVSSVIISVRDGVMAADCMQAALLT